VKTVRKDALHAASERVLSKARDKQSLAMPNTKLPKATTKRKAQSLQGRRREPEM